MSKNKWLYFQTPCNLSRYSDVSKRRSFSFFVCTSLSAFMWAGWFDGPEQQQYTVAYKALPCDACCTRCGCNADSHSIMRTSWMGAEWVAVRLCMVFLTDTRQNDLRRIQFMWVGGKTTLHLKFYLQRKNRPLFAPSSLNFRQHSQWTIFVWNFFEKKCVKICWTVCLLHLDYITSTFLFYLLWIYHHSEM